MVSLTAKQISDLDRMNEASHRAGGLGTILSGGIPVPDVGSVTLMSQVKYRTNPVLADTDYVHATIAQTDAVQLITTGITNPDVPRNLTVTGNASGNAGNVVITGTNINDVEITETFALSGTSAIVGTKAFKTVTSISVPIETHAGTDSLIVGIGSKIGFPVIIGNASLVYAKSFDLLVDAGTVNVGTTVEGSTYTPAGTLNGVKFLDLYIST